MKPLSVLLLVLSTFNGFSQIPDSIRFDWNVCGENQIQKDEININVLFAGFNNNGQFDNTQQLQTLINSHTSDSQLVVYFPTGKYKFTGTIFLRSGITIVGDGATKTKFIFDNGGTGNLFEISTPQTTNFRGVKNGLTIHSNIIEVDGEIISNNYYELLIDGEGLATSDWAMKSIGQVFKIDSTKNKNAYLSTELKLDYRRYKNPKIRLITPITDVHFQSFSLERKDKTIGQTNNFNFMYAANCTVIGVESYKSNMSHVTLSKSYGCRVADSYFHHAFDYGGGGKAYGVELSYSAGNCLVENNIFENLRHSILLQSGANGNVISGNYSVNPYWTEGILPPNSAGELVLHGNYPFANLFEGNQVGNIVVDNSHGLNGPGNVFYRNKASVWGVYMNSGAGHETHFIGNEITGPLNTTTGNGNLKYVNYTNSTDPSEFKDVIIPQSFYLKSKPLWWPTKKVYPALGLPLTKLLADIPARFRYNHDSLRALNSLPGVFLVNFKPSLKKVNEQYIIELESKLQVNGVSLILEKLNNSLHAWQPSTNDLSNGFLFQTEIIKEYVLLGSDTVCFRWVAKGINGQKWISDSFCINNQSASAQNLKPKALLIYPNPASDYINIDLSKPFLVKLYTIYGVVMFESHFPEGQATINLSHLPNANYIVEAYDGSHYSRQMIIKL